jgi:hypothetical protein
VSQTAMTTCRRPSFGVRQKECRGYDQQSREESVFQSDTNALTSLRPESGRFRSGSARPLPQLPLRETAALRPPRIRACLSASKALRSASSPICSCYDARSRCARSARLGLRKWSNAPLRAFHAERRGNATPRPASHGPVARDSELLIPLFETSPQNLADSRSPNGHPLGPFVSRHFAPLWS